MKKFAVVQYLKDSVAELKKVTWPTRKEAMNSTLVVVLFSVGIAAFLGIIDFGFTAGLNYLISLTA
ncbi:MAG: preprotein translocase subunit SecE [Patescibacteria group bacterium]|jgi:preprotein translocase subunit SecE